MSFKLTDFITVSNTGITTFGSDGILINRTGADAYLFFQNSGTNRGAIYGGDPSGNAGLRFYVGNNSDPSIVLDSNGQVGIGATPGGFFDVSYDAATYNAPRLTDTRSFAINNGAGLDFLGKYNTAGNTARFGSIYGKKENATDGNNAGYLEFQTNNVARLTISSKGAASFASNSNSTIENTFTNSDTTDGSTRNYLTLTAGNRFLQFQANNADTLNINRTSGADLKVQEGGSTQFKITTGGDATFSGDVSVFPKQIIASYASSDSGTAANPSYAFYANETMGMYPAGTNTLGFSTDGTARLTIDPSGKVGIGITPTETLTIGGTAQVQLTLKSNDTSSGNSEIYFGDSDATYRGFIGYSHSSDAMSFGTDGSIKLTFTSDGKVGIGDTDPEELLEIKASSAPAIQLNQGDTYKGIIRLGGNDLEIRGSGGLMEFYNGSDDGDSSTLRLSITNKGAIGQAVTPITDPYVAGSEQWMTYQIGKMGIMGAYKTNNESMFGVNTYIDSAGLNKAITSGTNGTAVRFYADSITFNHLTSTGTSQTQTQLLSISSAGVTTLPSGNNPDLIVNGTAVVKGNSSSYNTHWFTTQAANVAKYEMRDANGDVKNTFSAGGDNYITGGAFGIGMTAPAGPFDVSDTNGRLFLVYGFGLTYLTNQSAYNAGSSSDNRLIFEGRYRSSFNDATALGEIRVGKDAYTDGYYGGNMQFWTRINGGAMAERARISTAGNFIAGATSDVTGTHYFNKTVSANGGILYAGSDTTGRFSLVVNGSDMAYNNTPATCLKIGGTNSTSRSISAAGTVNASGADYAEYMTKAVTDTIGKGDIVGVNSDGLLTTAFDDSISFVIKSTDPSLVGNDTWGIESEDEDEMEEARIKVDRVAFSGQVPCNVTGASVGDYIIPVASSDGKITGEAVSNPTFEQYKLSVGKVWKIMEDGRSWVAVKIG